MERQLKNTLFFAVVLLVVLILVYGLFFNMPQQQTQTTNVQNEITPQQLSDKPLKGGTATGDGGTGVETSGEYQAALNYKVTRDGFKFENYGEGYKNLDATELQRMFGDGVCASNANGKCTLTPPAEQWMNAVSKSMSGGHCEGMATLSLLFNKEQLKTDEFGASTAYELAIQENEKLQHEIAYWFATQATEPTSASAKKFAPNEVVEKLTESFKNGGESYTLGIYKRDMTAGHAITPWAIEDKGDGIVWILVYDNNYPGVNRAVVVDKGTNTWKYTASTNPNEQASEYDGDATTKNLELTPTSARLSKQVCSFCDSSETKNSELSEESVLEAKGSLAVTYNEIWVDGKGDILITDTQGKKLGFDNGVLIQEIPGAKYNVLKGTDSKTYVLPMGIEFTFVIDGARVNGTSSTDIVMFGPGYDLGILNITLSKERKDSGFLASKGNNLSYTTSGTETPDIIYGIETNASDYGFSIKAVGLQSGGTINSALDTVQGKLSVNTKGNKNNVTLFFEMSRIDETGEQDFGNEEGIMLEPNDTIYFNYAKWTGNKGKLVVELDSGSNGTIDETVELNDDI